MGVAREDLEELIRIVGGLTNQEILGLQNNLTMMLKQKSPDIQKLPQDLPDLHVPPYVLMTFMEYLFISFIEELFHNFKDDDYETKNLDEATNTNKVSVFNMFNHLSKQQGQYPRVVVRALKMRLSPETIGGADPMATNNNLINRAAMSIPMSISVLSKNYNEANILGNIITISLLANLKKIKQVFNIGCIVYPEMDAPQTMEESPDLYMAQIQFDCNKTVRWDTVTTVETFSEMFLRIAACVKGDLTEPIVQIIGNIKSLDPNLIKLFKSLGSTGTSL
jgi:hypothetical protein